MANQEHLNIILDQGIKAWNQWRKENPEVQPDLYGACLSEKNLKGANLQATELSGAKLYGTDLTKANLSYARLIGSHLYGAKLVRATLHGTYLSRANLMFADLSKADLNGAHLDYTILVFATLTDTILTNCTVHGISAWDIKGVPEDQSNLFISSYPQEDITVDKLEVAQLTYLLLDHKKVGNVINSLADRGVLILGRFGEGGIEVLKTIATELRKKKYLPFIFDFDRPKLRDMTETVRTLAGLSKFVIADLSGSSVPGELQAIVPDFMIPYVLILQKGRKRYAMAKDILRKPWVVKPVVEFITKEHLIKLIPTKILAPAEEKHREIQKELEQLFER